MQTGDAVRLKARGEIVEIFTDTKGHVRAKVRWAWRGKVSTCYLATLELAEKPPG